MSEPEGLFELANLTTRAPAEPGPLDPWARMQRTAVLSEDHAYRYAMVRQWDAERPTLAWLMLNPSEANDERDDPTTVRVVNFTADWGYGAALFTNLFALVSSKPTALVGGPDPIGPGNTAALRSLAGMDVVCAWGASVPDYWRHRPRAIRAQLAAQGCTLYHLGLTKGGHPRHPLYLAATTQRERWA